VSFRPSIHLSVCLSVRLSQSKVNFLHAYNAFVLCYTGLINSDDFCMQEISRLLHCFCAIANVLGSIFSTCFDEFDEDVVCDI